MLYVVLKILGELTYLACYVLQIHLLCVNALLQCLDLEGGGQH